MAIFVARDFYIAINGTSLSDHASDLTLDDQADQIELTAFGPAAYKSYGQGFKDAKITCTFFSDFAASSVHALLQPLYQNNSTFTVEIRPTSSAASSTNPKASMTASLFAYSPIAGKVGAAAEMTVTFQNYGTAGLVWATA